MDFFFIVFFLLFFFPLKFFHFSLNFFYNFNFFIIIFSIYQRGSPEFDRFLQKETWNRVEEMIEPLSPPKLLYFDEEKVITYSEEASQFHEKTINNMSIFKEKSNINTINYNNSNNNNNESKEIVKKPRIRIILLFL